MSKSIETIIKQVRKQAVAEKLNQRDEVVLLIDLANDNDIDLVPVIPLKANGEEDHQEYDHQERTAAMKLLEH